MTTAGQPLTGALEELRSLLENEGGLLAGALRPATSDPGHSGAATGTRSQLEVFGPLVSAGRRTSEDALGYALVIESIFEGYLLHYCRGRIVADPDPDVRLLAGDHLYALGLVRLANIGDLEAVEELSDLISLCSRAHAASNGAASPWELTGALWANAVLAVAEGSWAAGREAKQLARERGAEVIKKVLDAARDRAQELRLTSRLEQALIAFQRTVEGDLSTA